MSVKLKNYFKFFSRKNILIFTLKNVAVISAIIILTLVIQDEFSPITIGITTFCYGITLVLDVLSHDEIFGAILSYSNKQPEYFKSSLSGLPLLKEALCTDVWVRSCQYLVLSAVIYVTHTLVFSFPILELAVYYAFMCIVTLAMDLIISHVMITKASPMVRAVLAFVCIGFASGLIGGFASAISSDPEHTLHVTGIPLIIQLVFSIGLTCLYFFLTKRRFDRFAQITFSDTEELK